MKKYGGSMHEGLQVPTSWKWTFSMSMSQQGTNFYEEPKYFVKMTYFNGPLSLAPTPLPWPLTASSSGAHKIPNY